MGSEDGGDVVSNGASGVGWPPGTPDPLAELSDQATEQVKQWLRRAKEIETRAERKAVEQLSGVVSDPAGVGFAMRFVDRVIRPEDHRTAAGQLVGLVDSGELPDFLSPVDKLLLKAGAKLAPTLPQVVMPLAAKRMRGLVGHLVVDSDPAVMAEHLGARSSDGFSLNVNLLGEAVLGDKEADRRHAEALRLLDQPDVDYVSVKVSAVVSQLNEWDYEGSLERVIERLRPLFEKAARTSPPTFINLDMEEYHDLELTLDAFMDLLNEPEFHSIDAGIVLQAYLPDSFEALKTLERWATARHQKIVDGKQGGTTKVRLVKGANLAMENVDAAMSGWELAPYRTKAETDANYKRCLDWLLTPDRTAALRVGVASHNLFDIAFAHLLADRRQVSDRIEFEMLEGMAPAHARAVRDSSNGMLLYTPAVAEADFDVAISYLFRRLEENATDENFIHHLFEMEPEGPAMQLEEQRFRDAVRDRWEVGAEPQRTQNRLTEEPTGDDKPFVNEPDTDPTLPANREWAATVIATEPPALVSELVDDPAVVDSVVATARAAQVEWHRRPASDRRQVLRNVAAEIARRRGDLVSAMIYEANKTFAQADLEISEAIDFARYYGDRSLNLDSGSVVGAEFSPLGVLAIVPPWNFPVAIPLGGVTSSLAAGNAVILKPAPETPKCAEILAECCWQGGVPADVLHFLRVPDNDTGKHLITHDGVDGIILTGAYETAELFRSWKPELTIFAETSGKNALIITENSDIDLAVSDLVASAFGHSGQKCSAASLGICVGGVYDSPRLRRQLVDAVASLEVGPANKLSTSMGPTIVEPEGKLLRGLTELDDGETWLLKPTQLESGTWTPGIRLGVAPGSWFHQTECFGPVLGLMKADDLEGAIEAQNASAFGLTGGIHSLDEEEIDLWLEKVEVGNAYINRQITGAIVQRQPFGGWKRSAIGPGAKAGGPNYVAQLGTWEPTDRTSSDSVKADEEWLAKAKQSDTSAWASEFSVDHDPTALFCEANIFRYRPLDRIVVRLEKGQPLVLLDRVSAAARICGVPTIVSTFETETAVDFANRLADFKASRIRVIGPVDPAVRDAANAAEVHLVDDPVTSVGRIELLHYLKEQAVSKTLHRYGNLL